MTATTKCSLSTDDYSIDRRIEKAVEDAAEKISRRSYLKYGAAAAVVGGVAAALGYTGMGKEVIDTGKKVIESYVRNTGVPEVYGQEKVEDKYKIDVPIALKPLFPEDLENGNWLKTESWEDSIEKPYYPNIPSEKEAYLRLKWGEEYLAALVDAVTDANEKPYIGISFGFDTYNIGKNEPRTPGDYEIYVMHTSPGGYLKNVNEGDPNAPGNPFPPGTLHYTWSVGQSPIADNNEARLKLHALCCFLFSKQLLTSRYNEINFITSLWDSSDFKYRYPPPVQPFAKMNFSTTPIPEPWSVAAIILGIGLLATNSVTRIIKERKAITNST